MQTPWGDFTVSDAHAHFFSRRFFDSLAAQSGKGVQEVAATLGWQLPAEDPAELAKSWAAELDGYGVSQAALIASIPGAGASFTAARAAPPRSLAFSWVTPRGETGVGAPALVAFSLSPPMPRSSM